MLFSRSKDSLSKADRHLNLSVSTFIYPGKLDKASVSLLQEVSGCECVNLSFFFFICLLRVRGHYIFVFCQKNKGLSQKGLSINTPVCNWLRAGSLC